MSSITLDGEAMRFDRKGRDDFDALWSRSADQEVQLCAFDLLEIDGEDLRSLPLIDRKRRLRKLLRRPQRGLQYVEHFDGCGVKMFEHVCRLGLEGIVSKRIDLRYQAGRSKSWIKVKNTAHPSVLRVREAFEWKRRRGRA